MKRLLIKLSTLLSSYGFCPVQTVLSIRATPCYLHDYWLIKRQKKSDARFSFGFPFPCLQDKYVESGTACGHYFHQDLQVARRVYINNPRVHVDVGSRLDGFVAHVASFRKITVMDVRPLACTVPNVEFIQTDLMAPVEAEIVGCCDSLSCLHVLEHFGLGRYGDPVSYDGYRVGLLNLTRMLQGGGKLYISVPIGPQRIEFNAHRVFSVDYFLELISDIFCVDQFSFVDDKGALHENVPLEIGNIRNNFGCIFGCGIFEMTKR